MATYVAAFATRVAESADAVARSLAPVDLGGADSRSQQRATHHGPALRVADVLQKSAQDVRDMAVRGSAFRLSDIPAYVDALKNANGGVGIDDRKMLLEKLLTLLSRLPDDSEFEKTLQVFVIDTLYKDLPHPPASYLPATAGNGAEAYPSTNPSDYTNGHANGSAGSTSTILSTRHPYDKPSYGARRPYAARSADGTGYSTVYSDMGAAGKPYARTVPSTHPNTRWPDAGLVFDTLLARSPSRTKEGVLPSSDPNAVPGNTTLPPTNAEGFAPQPGGLSSLFFAFADLVIHSVFNTSHSNWAVNSASSYLDLSPLYGSSEADVQKVRRCDGTGSLWDDVFADGRVLFMPPSVPALLVLFCRNHNFIASKLLTINEFGTFVSGASLEALNEEKRKEQDDEIFARARLVNCAWFMRVILGDYVGAILGLVRDGLAWRLDPLAESRELDHTVSPRGEGNVVSLEFNLLYRWHAALSERDILWTEHAFEELFGTTDFKSITVDDFQHKLGKIRNDPDVRKWTFEGVDNKRLSRDSSTGAFKSADIAALLQTATASHAGAFKARGIPQVLRVVEIMGIEQARQWGTATMNEFRKFMGLKTYATFAEWNSDPDISKAAQMLYGDIDNLELHVGLQAEESKPPITGAGLCPGYTISRAILADAVALVRGDRFLTTDFTVYNLTAWGYSDCFPEKKDGAYGGVLARLLFRTLPEYYPARSAYGRFPFMVPEVMRSYLERLVDSPVAKYDFGHPQIPGPTKIEERFEVVKSVLTKKTEYRGTAEDKLISLVDDRRLDIALVNEVLNTSDMRERYSGLLGHITGKLIEERSILHPGSARNLKYVDIVRDVINLVPVYFVATELLGLPIKTKQTPHGLFRDTELSAMFADTCNYVFLNTEPYIDWVLREKSAETSKLIIDVVYEHLNRLANQGLISRVTDSLIQLYTGEDKFSDTFLAKVLAKAPHDKRRLAKSIFATLVPSLSMYSKAIVNVVDFFLEEEQAAMHEEIVLLARENSTESDMKLYKFAREALRLNPPVSTALQKRKLRNDSEYEELRLSLIKANLDSSVFGSRAMDADFHRSTEKGILGMGDYGLTNPLFFERTVPKVLRTIFNMKNLQRAPGRCGTLDRVVEIEKGCPEVRYLDSKSQITPFPSSMVVQFES